MSTDVDLAELPHLRTSERKAFKRCPQRWWWGYREGLRSQGPPNEKLWFGTGWHLVMAHWYKGPGTRRGRNPLKVWRDWIGDETVFIRTKFGESAEYAEEKYVEAGELGERMLEAYFETYGKDPTWHVIAPEQTFEILIPNSAGIPIIRYNGTFDLVYRDLEDELVKLGEHKTAKAIMLGHLPLDDQGGSYWTVATSVLRNQNLIGPKERIHAITYNFARKAKPDERPKDENGMSLNKDGTVSKVQPSPLFVREDIFRTSRERNTMIRRIAAEAETMNLMRTGELPLFKTPTSDCSWDCDFYNMCLLHEADADFEEFRDAIFRVEDPYADHRKSAAE